MCPICGAECGFREIDPYYREARELWPPSSGWVPVARFQCRGTAGRYPTFSMLPYQLVPYHRYTLSSMIQAVLLWREFWKDPEEAGTGYQVEQLVGEVSSWQLHCWLLAFQHWLRRAQVELAGEFDFTSVRFAGAIPGVLDEVFEYFESLSRGPPGRGGAVVCCVREHGERRGRFLFGTPSQGR